MRNRSGQFTGRRVAADMGEFCHALFRLYFRPSTLMMLMKQDRDKRGLCKNNCHDERDLPGIALPGGRSLSLIPKRCICRQSNLGGVKCVGGVLMSPAFSPSRIRIAAAAATALPSRADCMDPPRIASPNHTSRYEKIGALAAAESLLSAVLASCATTAV